MTSIVNQKSKIDAWVELHGRIWRWRKGGKLAHKSTANYLVGDPGFIARRKCVQIWDNISWWGWEAGYICHFWICPEEFRKPVRDIK